MKTLKTSILVLVAACSLSAHAQTLSDETIAEGPFEANWESLAGWQCPEWFRDAKFGLWAHWGPQCQAEAGDWYARNMYFPGEGQYNYHVSHGRNYYSVPYKMCKIGDTVTLRIYPDRIEIFDKDDKQQFCVHRRFRKNQIGQYDTDPAHMPPSRTGDWNKERFLRWSWTLGPNVHELVQQIFNGGRPEQVYYDKVHAILKIADTTEAAKLDRACRRCIDKSINPTTRNIKALIEADVKEEELKAKNNADENAWLRGDSYYAEKKQ